MQHYREHIGADDFRTFPRQLDGKARSRHHAEYAGWHRSACWNGRRFDRFPEYIVRAQSLDDVAHSIDFARAHGLSVSVRGSGHSYAGCFLRDAGLLLDLSALDRIEIDAEAGTASVQPGVGARRLSAALAPHGLAFPTGHGGEVGLSGFLLGGGLGINFRAWGDISAFSVRAVDLIDADGACCAPAPNNTRSCSGPRAAAGRGCFSPRSASTCNAGRCRPASPRARIAANWRASAS
ncbi:FAD-binding oxidoreductase [Lysobacter enzymogenes]|uniref:FAD-binding oxidoreductase n=1 Tax=Lysobacter enzymogenes TaxID=69 RepID=UPI001A95FB7C|nr:FAD-dependent oxidoreductase [Lysobacter enzymogenes]QQP95395.1 FAD-dependent oxidoreductase [Lysobacter enzymogenes]